MFSSKLISVLSLVTCLAACSGRATQQGSALASTAASINVDSFFASYAANPAAVAANLERNGARSFSSFFGSLLPRVGNGTVAIGDFTVSNLRSNLQSTDLLTRLDAQYGTIGHFLGASNFSGATVTADEFTAAVQTLRGSARQAALSLADKATSSADAPQVEPKTTVGISPSPFPGWDQTCSDQKMSDILHSTSAILNTSIGQMDSAIHNGQSTAAGQNGVQLAIASLNFFNQFCYEKQIAPYQPNDKSEW